MERENFPKDVNKASWRRDTGLLKSTVPTEKKYKRWMLMKMFLVGFVW
jgi:hypothetical protein